MFNLIKMDIYRLFHSKSTWIVLIFVVALAIFSVAMTKSDVALMKSDPQNAAMEQSGQRQIGIAVLPDPRWVTGNVEAGDLISAELGSGLLALLCVIFSAVFSNAEQKSGYIKNLAGQFPTRGKLIASTLVAISLHIFLMLFLFSAVTAAAGAAVWGGGLYLDSMTLLLKYLAAQYFLHLGCASVIQFFCILTRSTSFSMTAGILICSGLMVPIYSIMNRIVYDIRPTWNFDVNHYTLDGNIMMIKLDSAVDIVLQGALVGAVFTAVSLVLAMRIIQKRDIR